MRTLLKMLGTLTSYVCGLGFIAGIVLLGWSGMNKVFPALVTFPGEVGAALGMGVGLVVGSILIGIISWAISEEVV